TLRTLLRRFRIANTLIDGLRDTLDVGWVHVAGKIPEVFSLGTHRAQDKRRADESRLYSDQWCAFGPRGKDERVGAGVGRSQELAVFDAVEDEDIAGRTTANPVAISDIAIPPDQHQRAVDFAHCQRKQRLVLSK